MRLVIQYRISCFAIHVHLFARTLTPLPLHSHLHSHSHLHHTHRLSLALPLTHPPAHPLAIRCFLMFLMFFNVFFGPGSSFHLPHISGHSTHPPHPRILIRCCPGQVHPIVAGEPIQPKPKYVCVACQVVRRVNRRVGSGCGGVRGAGGCGVSGRNIIILFYAPQILPTPLFHGAVMCDIADPKYVCS